MIYDQIDWDNPEIVKAIKIRCLSDPKFYYQFIFRAVTGNPFFWADHHDQISKALLKVFLGKINRLVISAPPQSGKSVLTVPLFATWCFAHNPKCAFMNLSRMDSLIKRNSNMVRKIIGNEYYQKLFGLQFGKSTEKEWELLEGGEWSAVSAEGQIAGKPAGRFDRGQFGGALIADDIVKPKEANLYEKERDIGYLALQALQGRMATDLTPIILIMQRAHQDDPIGRIIDKDNYGGPEIAGDWQYMNFPALNENNETYWPKKFSTEYLLDLQKKDPIYFACEYMGDPKVDGGNLFKRAYWKFYKILPNIEYIIITADTAQKTGQANDYSVFCAWGKFENKIYLIDIFRQKLEIPELETALIAFCEKYKQFNNANLRQVYIEDKVSGTGCIQKIQRRGGIPVQAVQRNKDKIVRANDAIGYVSSGYVYLPEDHPLLSDFLLEHDLFPRGRNDDIVDNTCDAIDKLLVTRETQYRIAYL